MSELQSYMEQVSAARQEFLREIDGLNASQAHFKPEPEAWSISEITEHIVLAERIGVNRMWQAVGSSRKRRINNQNENGNWPAYPP